MTNLLKHLTIEGYRIKFKSTMDSNPFNKKGTFFAGFLILLIFALPVTAQTGLSLADVRTIIAQAVSKAVALNKRVTVSVTDQEGNLLGTFVMAGSPSMTRIQSVGRAPLGLEGELVPSLFASHSKAGTAGVFSTTANAFTTRTASFIIQEHFPPGVDNRPGGPLYGVQFSTLSCSDIAIAGLPLGLSGDPGGIPVYKNGMAVGGVGVEGDGIYTVDRDPNDNDQPFEEIIAAAATRGFESPPAIRADNILVEGIRLPFANVGDPPSETVIPFASLPGFAVSLIRAAPPSDFVPAVFNGVPGQMSTRFPTTAGATLSVAEVQQILGDAAAIANITRAAIRQPIGSNARVTIAVVDINGKAVGIFRQLDAPVFGFDVAVQKARTSVFFTRPDSGVKLQAAGFGNYVARASADGINLTGGIAFSDRALGFLHRPLFPDGINGTDAGPFSALLADWSPFNVGLQLDLVKGALLNPPMNCIKFARSKRSMLPPCPCTNIPEIPNGIQIFAGATPIYRGSILVGAIGVSGDGIDQDDFIAAAGANSFAPPMELRSDRIFVRGVRLPFLKFPARPTLP
ncbi:MAG: heme-binding protein [Acidobacteriota bacterium]|nr:heme-binding protein [Acidobacteriota bacterium]